MAAATPITSFPWQPDSTATAERAIQSLRQGLMTTLKGKRGIHTETILTAVGALAGFAVQNAALDRLASRLPRAGSRHLAFAIAHGKNGERYLFGDVFNIPLFPEPESVLPLGAIIAGAVINAGGKESDIPNYSDLAAHVASVVGSEQFGRLRAPKDHEPHFPPLEMLRRLWPATRDILQRAPRKRLFRPAEKPLQEVHWPILLSVVGSQLLGMTKNVLNPRIGAALLMESAVITSKIDPETIEPGKWRIHTGEDDPQPVTRLRQ